MTTLIEQFDLLKKLLSEFEEIKSVNQAGSARELKSKIDVSLSKSGSDTFELMIAANEYLKVNPKVNQPNFYKLLYSGLNKTALLGEWVSSVSNANMHTYQMSPVATLMELELIDQWNQLIGFEQGDGVMVSGGSQANLIAMMLARHQKINGCKEKGLQGKTLVAYVSDQAHYSNLRAANLLGIGTDNLVSVASDDEGRMRPDALQTQIETSLRRGHTPFYIGLTSGTTVIGAFDPIQPISKTAQTYDLWLHLDGAWGAPVLFSKKHQYLIEGVHLADSMSWDAHKLLNVPLTASCIQVKSAGLLKEAISGGGEKYLFHQDENAEYNLGERSIQCGRRADALKVWLSWKDVGSDGFAEKIDYLQELKSYFVEQVKARCCLELIAPTPYLNILFRYNPTPTYDEEQLRLLNITICEKLKKEGSAFIDYASFKGRSGIRLILANGEATKTDIDKVLGLIQNEGDLISKTND